MRETTQDMNTRRYRSLEATGGGNEVYNEFYSKIHVYHEGQINLRILA